MNKFKKAHAWAREIKTKYPEVDYKVQFGLCLSALKEKEVDVEIELPELEGTPKQVAWAEDIRNDFVKAFHFIDSYFMPIAQEELKGAINRGKKMTIESIENATYFLNKKKEVLNKTKATWFINNRSYLTKWQGETPCEFREYCEIIGVSADDFTCKYRNDLLKEIKSIPVFIDSDSWLINDEEFEGEEKEGLRIRVNKKIWEIYRQSRKRFAVDFLEKKLK